MHKKETGKKARRPLRWRHRMLCCLAVLAALGTAYAMVLPALTAEEQPLCGLHEHTHTQACYSEPELICGLTQTPGHTRSEDCAVPTASEQAAAQSTQEPTAQQEQPSTQEDAAPVCDLEESAPHTHTQACYSEPVLICGQQQHTHSPACYADAAADVETAELWEQTLPTALSGSWPEDLLAVAQSQLGYCESSRNYRVNEDGTRSAYSRYGAWYGQPYEAWSALFAAFCLQYAGVPAEALPTAADCAAWVQLLRESGQYTEATQAAVQRGDLVFLDGDADGAADHVGIAVNTPQAGEALQTVVGAWDGAVAKQCWAAGDSRILGVASLPPQTFGCGVQGHLHTAECYADGQLICPRSEHRHTAECRQPPAGEEPEPSEEQPAPEQPSLPQQEGLPVDCYVLLDDRWQRMGTLTAARADEAQPPADEVPLPETPAEAPTTADETQLPGEAEPQPSTDEAWLLPAQQLEKLLGEFGFEAATAAPEQLAVRPRGGTAGLCSAAAVAADGQLTLPAAETAAEPEGWELYYLPGNRQPLVDCPSPAALEVNGSAFYSVRICDAAGNLLALRYVLSGGTLDEAAPDLAARWLALLADGSARLLEGGRLYLSAVSGPVRLLPAGEEALLPYTVQLRVRIDEEWRTVGTLPCYYEGNVGSETRAYITSDAAAGVLAAFGYTADQQPGCRFASGYDRLYLLQNAQGECLSLAEDGTLAPAAPDGSERQYFRLLTQADGSAGFSPLADDSLCLNAVPGAAGSDVFAVESAAAGLPTAQIWQPTAQQLFSTDGSAMPYRDGYRIGLTAKGGGDLLCCYLPGQTQAFSNVSQQALPTQANGYWSVRVVDDTHSIYTAAEQEAMTQYAPDGGSVTVTVRNGDGMLWSCVGRGAEGVPLTVQETQQDGYTTFTLSNVTQPVEVTATKADPAFTVQYYAVIPRYAQSGSDPLTVIDTSGGVLPTNGGSMATRRLYLEGTGQKTTQNAGVATELYRVKTVEELTRMYREEGYRFESSPGLGYVNKLEKNESYRLEAVGVLKPGCDPASTAEADWQWYAAQENAPAFTNLAAQADASTILIQEGTVLRLRYRTTDSDYYNDTTFYDYDISGGKSGGRWRTGTAGINSSQNYTASRNGKRTWASGADVLAFGNQNCGTGMGWYVFDGGYLNAANSTNPGYQKATFGLVQGLNADGTLRYNDWIVAPNLFNEGQAKGKRTFAGSSLRFDRVGDTYTLGAATLKNADGSRHTVDGLQYFFHPSPHSGCIWDGANSGQSWQSSIFTNNFWPLDAATGGADGLWGAYGSEGNYQGYANGGSPASGWSARSGAFPAGDDGRAHNWFFGMNFSVDFQLTEDYVGPLEYTFFGDDDLWVFLDGRLVCDIGGVHSSIGEYVDLRDYLPEGSGGRHTLTFFYTERGASGSTCYMQFTLPSVSGSTVSRDTGALQLSKQVDAPEQEYREAEYRFQIDLLEKEGGAPLNQTFRCARSDGTYATVRSGGIIGLHHGETALISGLPAGAWYRVCELTTEGYATSVNGVEGTVTGGSIAAGGIQQAAFVNTPYRELPQTGGTGTLPYWGGGTALTAFAVWFDGRRRRKEACAGPTARHREKTFNRRRKENDPT